jgi:T-complex protein 1 subunit beta
MQAKAFDNTLDAEKMREDLMAIARTTLSSKILTHDKDYFAKIAVDAVMCLKGRTNLEPIHIIKKAGGTLRDSFLAEVRLLPSHIERNSLLCAYL